MKTISNYNNIERKNGVFAESRRTKGSICRDAGEMTVENRHVIIPSAINEQSKIGTVCAGGYAKLLTASGASVTVRVLNMDCDFADIEYIGGAKGFAPLKSLRPTAEHLLSAPEWLVAGAVISDGHYCQRVKYVTAKSVEFEWINGGCFSEDIATVIKSWQPYNGECEVLEVA